MRTALVLLSFFRLACSAQIYFYPRISAAGTLPLSVASVLIAQHLHLDRLEPIQDHGSLITGVLDQSFVGKGSYSSLLINIDEADAKYAIPAEDLPSPLSLSSPNSASILSGITRTSLQRATHAFSHVFDVSGGARNTFVHLLDIMNVSPPTETFVSELSALIDFLESDDLSLDRFGAFRITGLRTIADAYGQDSEQYRTGAASLTAALRSALTKPYLNLVILTYPQVGADGMAKRQDQSPSPPPRVPLPPVGSDALCFTSEGVCTNSTDSCSGHGACEPANKAGRLCYACSCEATKDSKGRTEYWAGGKCERKDVSGPFVLIAGTVITLILIIVGSVTLLYSIGSQPLPSVLTSSVPNMSVKE